MSSAPTARKAARMPKQPGREGQDVVAAVDQAERSHRVSPDHLRGEGKLKAGVAFAGGETKTISHGLGRTPKGWMVLSFRASAAVGRVPRETARSKSTITIANDSGNAFTCDLWIY